jgi:hypothetical protein
MVLLLKYVIIPSVELITLVASAQSRVGRGCTSGWRVRAGRGGSRVDSIVDGAGGYADSVGDLAWGQLSVGEQAGVGDVVVVAQVVGGDSIEGCPVPVRCPAWLTAAAKAALYRDGPMRWASAITAGSVLRSWMALRRRVTASWQLAPDYQRTPTSSWMGRPQRG